MQVKVVCKTCNKEFYVPHCRKNAKYCSPKCQSEGKKAENNLICPACGKHFHRKLSHIKRYKGEYGFYCSRECVKKAMKLRMSGEHNHQWGLKGDKNSSYKGESLTRKNHNNLDVFIYLPNHPFANRCGRVLLHRYIVEQNHELFDEKYFQIIDNQYYLKKGISVHHKDCNHSNNDISNLEPKTRGEHTSIHNKEKVIIRDKKGRILKIQKLAS